MLHAYTAEKIDTACLFPVSGDERLGLLGLYHTHDQSWPGDEVALPPGLRRPGAVAIPNARLYNSVGMQAAR